MYIGVSTFLQEIYAKKHTHAEMFRIGPGLIFFDF